MPARELSLEDLRERLAPLVAEMRPETSVTEIVQLVGGASSLTYSVGIGSDGERIIVKVAPPGVAPTGNRDVLRQVKLLEAIAGVPGVRVPDVLFTDTGDPPEIPPLFATDFVEGEPVEPLVDEIDGPLPVSDWSARAVAAAEMLGRLHRVDPVEVGLDDRSMSLEDEVQRWIKLFETVEDGLKPGADRCAEVLLERVPEGVRPSILHGDYRLGNMLCSGGSIRAVIDWEIWSLGDPRLDLAWLLSNTCGGQPTAIRTIPELPTPGELVSSYEQELGSQVQGLEWFDALVRFKAAAAIALIVKHNRSRAKPEDRLEVMAPFPPQFIRQALDCLGA